MLAPYLLQSEFASATLSLERRGQLLRQERLEAWATFRSLEIEYRWDDAWVDRAIEIADGAGQSRVYDSLYLACAEAYGFDLLTCDASFVRALGPNPPGVVRLVG